MGKPGELAKGNLYRKKLRILHNMSYRFVSIFNRNPSVQTNFSPDDSTDSVPTTKYSRTGRGYV